MPATLPLAQAVAVAVRSAVRCRLREISLRPQGKTFLVVRATNVGSKKTIITNVLVISYKNIWQRLRRRPSFTAIFNNVGGSYPIPYVLDVGHNFSSQADQAGLVEKIRDTYF